MRFMMLVKSTENSRLPPKELMEAIWKNGEDAAKAGLMIESGGLHPNAVSPRVPLRGGKVTAVDGPFSEAQEVVGGFAIFEFESMEEADESARDFMDFTENTGPPSKVKQVRPMFNREDFLTGTHHP